MIDIATVAVIALPSATIGAFLAYTFLPAKGEGSPNVCDDAVTIERLTGEVADLRYKVAFYRAMAGSWEASRDIARSNENAARKEAARLRTENRDLHIDIAEKAKRLSDAGLQSAGGEA